MDTRLILQSRKFIKKLYGAAQLLSLQIHLSNPIRTLSLFRKLRNQRRHNRDARKPNMLHLPTVQFHSRQLLHQPSTVPHNDAALGKHTRGRARTETNIYEVVLRPDRLD